MELIIGSNLFRGTTGILQVQGKEQIRLEIGKYDDQLLLTMDIYDAGANHIAKLRRNAWVSTQEERFEVKTSPTSLRLMDKETNEIVVEANVLDKDRIEIPRGRFYTARGNMFEITPQSLRIDDFVTMIGAVIDGCGRAIVID